MAKIDDIRSNVYKKITYGSSDFLGRLARQPEAKRFKDIQMLSFVSRMRPSSNQNLLQHSLDCYAIGLAVADALELDEKDRKIIAATGFLHDIGYFPFRHITDQIDVKGHEKRGAEITKYKIELCGEDSGNIPDILKEFGVSPKIIASLIDGTFQNVAMEKPYLEGIISGCMDIDKLAYIKRDSVLDSLGTRKFDICEVIDAMKIEKGFLCVNTKGAELVKKMSAIRNILYETLYNNPFSDCENEMLQRALVRGRIDMEDYFGCGDTEFLIKVEEELKAKSEKEERKEGVDVVYSGALKLIQRLRKDDPYPLALNIYNEVEDNPSNIETRLQQIDNLRFGDIRFGDIIVKFPYKRKDMQKKKTIDIPIINNHGNIRLKQVPIEDEYENMIKKEYGIETHPDKEIPRISIFCDKENKEKVIKAAEEYFELK